jgi:hypothetical protein
MSEPLITSTFGAVAFWSCTASATVALAICGIKALNAIDNAIYAARGRPDLCIPPRKADELRS